MNNGVNNVSSNEPFVSLPSPFVDERGAIQPLLEGGIHSVQIITSNKGSVRANHYHKRDSHYMYLASGSMKYIYRPAGSSAPPEQVTVEPGQMVFTPPMVEHAVYFLEDCTFLNVTTESRQQAAYEEDVVRVKLFTPE